MCSQLFQLPAPSFHLRAPCFVFVQSTAGWKLNKMWKSFACIFTLITFNCQTQAAASTLSPYKQQKKTENKKQSHTHAHVSVKVCGGWSGGDWSRTGDGWVVLKGSQLTANGHARDVDAGTLVVGPQRVILNGGPLAVQYNYWFGRNWKIEFKNSVAVTEGHPLKGATFKSFT